MYSSCVLYEDLMKHPQKTLLQLFGVLGISKDYLDDAMKAFQVDSQRDFFGSFNVLNENAKNKQVMEEMDKEFQRLSIPISTKMSVEDFCKLFE